MEKDVENTVKTKGAPRLTGSLYLVSAVLLLLGGVITLILNAGMGELIQGSSSQGFFYHAGALPAALGASFVIAGALLILSRKQEELFASALVILLGGSVCSLGSAGNIALLIALSAVLMLFSVRGTKINIAPAFLPRQIRIPVFNLVAILFALMAVWSQFNRVYSYGGGKGLLLFLLTVLPLAGLLLLNAASEPRFADPAEQSVESLTRLKSVPLSASKAFTIGAVLLILNGAGSILQSFSSSGFQINSLLLSLPSLIVGIILVNPEWREKGFLPAMVLLLIDPILRIRTMNAAAMVMSYHYRSMGEYNVANQFSIPSEFWFFALLPVVLMLISAIGVSWNVKVENLPGKLRVPVLNLAAAVLVAIDAIRTLYFYIPKGTGKAVETTAGEAASGLPIMAILLTLISAAGLILLNLFLDTRTVISQAKLRPDGVKYKRGFNGLVQRFYSNVGGGLKMLAKIQGIILLILAILGGLIAVLGVAGYLVCTILNDYDHMSMFLILMPSGIGAILFGLLGMLATWPLYAFGQITSDLREIKTKGVASGAAVSEPEFGIREENPDELPEL